MSNKVKAERHVADCGDCGTVLTINDLDLQKKSFVCPHCGSSKAEKPKPSPPKEKAGTIFRWSEVYEGEKHR